MSIAAEIGQALAAEFAIPDVGTLTVIVSRLATAIVLGGLLGMERERKGRAAGLKTHILVSAGSALFVLAPLQMGISGADVTRVMQGIVSGIGFLGAGAILKLDNEERIQGLTTAAGIWLTAAIGVAAGLGRESTAVLSTLLVLGVLALVPALLKETETQQAAKHPSDPKHGSAETEAEAEAVQPERRRSGGGNAKD